MIHTYYIDTNHIDTRSNHIDILNIMIYRCTHIKTVYLYSTDLMPCCNHSRVRVQSLTSMCAITHKCK